MGAGMAMRFLFGAVALLAVAACGSVKEDPLLGALKESGKNIGKKRQSASIEAQKAALIKRLKDSKSDAPILMVELPSRNAVATLSVAGENNGAITWFDPTGRSVTTRQGDRDRNTRAWLGCDGVRCLRHPFGLAGRSPELPPVTKISGW